MAQILLYCQINVMAVFVNVNLNCKISLIQLEVKGAEDAAYVKHSFFIISPFFVCSLEV